MVAKKSEADGKSVKKAPVKSASAKVKSVVKETKKPAKAVSADTKIEKKVASKAPAKKKAVKSGSGAIRETGRRKTSVAKVALVAKSGDLQITVNGLDFKQYCTKLIHQDIVFAPFAVLGVANGYVVNVATNGGGKSGQADAIKLGLSKCLASASDEFNVILRKHSFLTRDARQVEPKKYGLKKARKKEQFSKR